MFARDDKSELNERLLSDNPDLSENTIALSMDVLFNAIIEQLAQGGRVELRGFGSFSVRYRAEHVGRNPRSGVSVKIAAKGLPYFKPGKKWLKLARPAAAQANAPEAQSLGHGRIDVFNVSRRIASDVTCAK